MTKHDYRLQQVLSLARGVKPVAGSRMAAALVWRGYTFYGYNSKKTHPMMAKWGKNPLALCLHAEIDALKNCMKRLHPVDLEEHPATMYVARAKADGSPGMAKPCEGCQRALVAFGIADVYWTEG